MATGDIMIRVDRNLFRTQMKKEYKKFLKENKIYKNITFSQFVEFVKANIVKLKKQSVASQSVVDGSEPHVYSDDHNHDHELQDMFSSVEEGDETASTTE
jgi:hypothetical protein